MHSRSVVASSAGGMQKVMGSMQKVSMQKVMGLIGISTFFEVTHMKAYILIYTHMTMYVLGE
jgi:hypothetical protein